jgi:hypothetical protein
MVYIPGSEELNPFFNIEFDEYIVSIGGLDPTPRDGPVFPPPVPGYSRPSRHEYFIHPRPNRSPTPTAAEIRARFFTRAPAVVEEPAVVANDDEPLSRFDNDEDHDPESEGTSCSQEDGDSSEDDSSSEGRPTTSSWKRPVGVGAGGKGKGKWSSVAGVASVDAATVQEVIVLDDSEEEDEVEEEVDDDDDDDEEEEEEDDDDDYAPLAITRPRRAVAVAPAATAATSRPARVSAAPAAPTTSSRKGSAWSAEEDRACIAYMREICTQSQYADIAGTERRFQVVADSMAADGFDRSAAGVKLQWNRRLRAASGVEDRGDKKHSGSGLTTSSLKGTTAAAPAASTASASSSSSAAAKPARSQVARPVAPTARTSEMRPAKRAREPEAAAPVPRKQPRLASQAPTTQDVAYYSLSTANIINTPRSSRSRRPIVIEDEGDEE